MPNGVRNGVRKEWRLLKTENIDHQRFVNLIGIGVDPDELPNFEEFSKGDGTSLKRFSITG